MGGQLRYPLDYPRHLILLIAAAVALALVARDLGAWGATGSVAVFGAVHAASLALALRDGPSTLSKLGFVCLAGALAALALWAGILTHRLFGTMLGRTALPASLCVSAATGAFGYLTLMRCFSICCLSKRALLQVPLCCVLAVMIAWPLGLHLQLIGGWWFAITWWFAFSLMLWSCDRPGTGLMGAAV